MNEQLIDIFNIYKNLRSAQGIVQEILIMDNLVYNYNEDEAKYWINHFINKYNRDIKLISSIKRDIVVIENDEHLYDEKTEEDITEDVAYIRDCLIVIGAVKTGIRQSYRDVIDEIGGL